MIKAPFNFVPISDQVFFPDWADYISHDIPFEDGESGTIELKITAASPVFVRNGHTKKEAEDKTDTYQSFSKVKDRCFIPATSMKGAIRNVLEILSFGKMNQIQDTRYSLRDLQLKKEYLSYFQNDQIHCGWMQKNGSLLTVHDHGIPRRISHHEIDTLWNTTFEKTFGNPTNFGDNPDKDKNKTACFKIEMCEGKCKLIRYNEFKMNSANSVDNRIVANYDENGQFEGTIVLTGQPGVRKDRVMSDDKKTVIKKGSGKKFEFVFPSAGKELCSFPEDNELYTDFNFIYHDSTDWKYWKNKLELGEKMPIFFSTLKGKLSHFGLSYLYKLPYIKRTKEYLPANHRSPKLDFAECLFGVTQKKDSLKGRVQFSHLFLAEKAGDVSKETLKSYMGSPKSSYYPIYIQQKGESGAITGNFKTMMANDAELKGWKRYPIHETTRQFEIPEGMKEENTQKLIPIMEGAVFTGKVRFHNLKKAEIGALLGTLLFSPNGYHSIGFAKAYGYGKIKVEINPDSLILDKPSGLLHTVKEYTSCFTELMKEQITDYGKSQELQELKLMSIPQELTTPLEYMELSDFVDCKKQDPRKGKTGEYLEYYSALIKAPKPVEKETIIADAIVTLVAGKVIKAKLLTGSDLNTKDLDCGGKIRPKEKQIIKVEVKRNGNNIVRLFLKSIIK